MGIFNMCGEIILIGEVLTAIREPTLKTVLARTIRDIKNNTWLICIKQ